jgi:hypothetical protein
LYADRDSHDKKVDPKKLLHLEGESIIKDRHLKDKTKS